MQRGGRSRVAPPVLVVALAQERGESRGQCTPLKLGKASEPGIETAEREAERKLRAGGAGEEIAVRGSGLRPQPCFACLQRRERPRCGQPRIDHGRDGDRALVVSRQIGLRTAAQPFAIAGEAFEQRGAGVRHCRIAEPEVLRRRLGRRTRAQQRDPERAQKAGQGPRALLRQKAEIDFPRWIDRLRVRARTLQRPIFAVHLHSLEVEPEHFRPTSHGALHLPCGEGARKVRRVQQVKHVVSRRVPRLRSGVAFEEPGAEVRNDCVGSVQDLLRPGGGAGWDFHARFRARRHCRIPGRAASAVGGLQPRRQGALHLRAFLSRAHARQLALHDHGWNRAVQARIPWRTHQRPLRQREQLLRGSGLERERPRPGEEGQQRLQARDPGRPARVLRFRIGEGLARLRNSIGAGRQLVRPQELGQGLKRRQPRGPPVALAAEPRRERCGVLAEVWQLAEHEPLFT